MKDLSSLMRSVGACTNPCASSALCGLALLHWPGVKKTEAQEQRTLEPTARVRSKLRDAARSSFL